MSTPTTPAPNGTGHREWWRDAVVYQVYVRSYSSSGTRGGGAGIGDLPGITSRLPHLRDLGVDAVWITPFYTSPQHDHGYDVADYRDVDRLFGTLADADDLVATAHDLGLKVIVDLVPNHTSDEHVWFRAALAAAPGSRERARYLFRDGRDGPDGPGTEPPNNWQSVFGGAAWTRVPDGQWYLHLFDTTQPDLDWRNPEIGDMFEDVLRFWLDRGADGFRVDVAHGLVKEESLRDQDQVTRPHAADTPMVERTQLDEPMWDRPEVHDVYRRWHRVLADYPGDRMTVAEAWTSTPESMARYVRPDEMQQAFNFAWLLAKWSAQEFADVVTGTFASLDPVGASPTWVLSNHDVVRHVTRYGGGERGLARARAATLTMLGLPGSSYLYQGEELGLEQVDVAPEDRQDPSWFRTGEVGRDGCRVPVPWSGDAPPYGFGPGDAQPWIPQPLDWAGLTVEAQTGVDGSTLEFYRAALAARRALTPVDGVRVSVDGDVLLVERDDVTIAVNCGDFDAPLPAGRVLLASGPVGDTLPPDTAVWLTAPRG
ncbi:alpha-amylase family glycosyl hydrolase [Nocardioides sp.]|uniref:glycoside hydrolase family 13 protein n=1 Tax=Nocardioides sp. TaxID=35761 RepID=UPI00271C4871|nr:alpha-amylase family glycosyl hydrolase [Nocardioides sp.]MDO9455922.1 alpha-amylase family glycosyl hydrolase [Nocardioides sp.]